MAENIRKILYFAVQDQIAAGNMDGAWDLIDLRNMIDAHPAVQSGALPDRYSIEHMLLHEDEVSQFTESERLMLEAKQKLDTFFGFDVEVPPPPDELLQTLDKLRQHNIQGFAAHYLPDHTFTREEDFPGWKDKPNPRYWDLVQKGVDIPTTTAGWYLIDTYSGYDYLSEPTFRERTDYFDETISRLRETGDVPILRRGTENSRLGIGVSLIERVILPGLAEKIGVTQEVRLPTGIEFNVLGNMAHPEWGQKPSYEYFSTKGTLDFRMVGGGNIKKERKIPETRLNVSGLSEMHYFVLPDDRDDGVGFRPLIVFPTIPQ